MATILVVAAAGAHLLDSGTGAFPALQLAPGQSPDAWEPLLVAAAGLCVAGLTVRRSRWVAWFATAAAATLGAVDAVAQVRTQLTLAGPPAWPGLVGASAASATLAAVICAVVAWTSSAELRAGPVRSVLRVGVLAGLAAVLVLEAAALLPTLNPSLMTHDAAPIDQVRAANRALLIVLAMDLGVAAMVLGAPRWGRAWGRSQGRVAIAQDAGRQPPSVLQALADEFVPGLRSRADRAAAAERERLAADLHARVVPELRRAIAANPPAPASAAGDLRGALDDVEALMAERHSVVLEEFGLVAALEWLAERTEARSETKVELDIGDETAADRPPRAVERAAFRIAMLAVENAVRHAPGSAVTVEVTVTAEQVRLDVVDAGAGIDADAAAAARRDGHRGLADMETAAADVGATLKLGRGPAGTGTRVSFAWKAR